MNSGIIMLVEVPSSNDLNEGFGARVERHIKLEVKFAPRVTDESVTPLVGEMATPYCTG